MKWNSRQLSAMAALCGLFTVAIGSAAPQTRADQTIGPIHGKSQVLSQALQEPARSSASLRMQ